VKSQTDARLRRLAQQALGPSGRLVYLHEIHDGWWQGRVESDNAKSAIIVQSCSRAQTSAAIACMLLGIASPGSGEGK
jgi:hypothetical protein